MASLLIRLPSEVIENVVSSLDRDSLSSVRLTCRELNLKTLHYFGRTYFTAVSTDFSDKSLQKLQSMSENEQFRNHVRSLLIKECDNDFTCGSHWIWVNDSGHLDPRNSPGVHMLRCVLTNLVKCQSCRIYSFGADREPQHYECGNMEPSNALYIILSIITEIALPVTSFHLEFHYNRNVYGTQSQLQLCQQPGLLTAWKNIEELCLEHLYTSGALDWAQDLILHTPSLKKLSFRQLFRNTTLFLDSLLSFPILLQGLQEFRFEIATVSIDVLLALLLRCRFNLRVLSLQHITIKSGAWADILTDLRTFPLLEDIEVISPAEYRNGAIPIQFSGLEKNREVPGSEGRKFTLMFDELEKSRWVHGIGFRGRMGMDKALRILAESAEIRLNNDSDKI